MNKRHGGKKKVKSKTIIPSFPSPWTTMLALHLLLYCSDRTRTVISILTSAADNNAPLFYSFCCALYYLVVSDFGIWIVLRAENLQSLAIGLLFAVVVVTKHAMVLNLSFVLWREGGLRFNLKKNRDRGKTRYNTKKWGIEDRDYLLCCSIAPYVLWLCLCVHLLRTLCSGSFQNQKRHDLRRCRSQSSGANTCPFLSRPPGFESQCSADSGDF